MLETGEIYFRFDERGKKYKKRYSTAQGFEPWISKELDFSN